MPEQMERALREEAIKRRLTGDRKNAFIYGTMRKTGWTPSTQKSKEESK